MINIVFAANDDERWQLNKWCANEFWPGKDKQFENFQALAIIDDDTLIGCVLFHHYNDEYGTIELTIATTSKRWVTRRTIGRMAKYVFDEANCQAAVVRTDKNNKHIRSMLRRAGFAEYSIPRLRGRTKPEIILVLSDDEWNRSKFNKQEDQS